MIMRGGMIKVCGVAIAFSMLVGCSRNVHQEQMSPEIIIAETGVLGDLNHYVQRLMRLQAAGNAEAEKILVNILMGKGIPVSDLVEKTG